MSVLDVLLASSPNIDPGFKVASPTVVPPDLFVRGGCVVIRGAVIA